MKVPYVSLGSQWEEEKQELLPIIEQVMASGLYIGGSYVDSFERRVCNYLGAKFCVALNSGTDALVCAMAAVGIKPGDEVITPPNSFIASTAAIVHLGAIPIFADVCEDMTIDPAKVGKLISPKTKAIMPVHLTGQMSQMEELADIAKKEGLYIIEDAAQSMGSKYKGKLSGTLGHVGCFSAHPLKNLNACGDAGFLVTENQQVAENVRRMRNHGLVDRNIVETFGYVSRMDALQAAILSFRLTQLEGVIKKRRRNAEIYMNELDSSSLVLPKEPQDYFNSYHTFIIRTDLRDKLKDYLASNQVETAIHYPVPIHLQPAATKFGYRSGSFFETEKQASQILTLPIHQFLSEAQILFVCEKINEFLSSS